MNWSALFNAVASALGAGVLTGLTVWQDQGFTSASWKAALMATIAGVVQHFRGAPGAPK